MTDDELNEDWLRSLAWDHHKDDGSPVIRFSEMWPEFKRPLTSGQLAEVQHFTALPAWEAAPAKLKREVDAVLAESTAASRVPRQP